MSWYTDIKAWIANNIRTNHHREITGAKMNTVLNDIVDEVENKVDKVSGKGLSTNDYNNTEKAKVANSYSKPSGGIPKSDLSSAVQTSLGKADTAVQTETDPTVPSWAKSQTKPTYTASEVGAIAATDKGANGGVATLDNAGKVPQSQLPSYVDDVLEYANLASFPATGESGKIYVALDTNKTYRWSGSAYVEISESLALGETSSTAFPGDRGKAIEDKIPSNASSSNKLATKTESVPAGGTTGQVLAKKSNTDNDLEWVNQSGGGVTLPDGALYGGTAWPNEPPTYGDDHRYFYLAYHQGNYPAFNIELDGNSLALFYWLEQGQAWYVDFLAVTPIGLQTALYRYLESKELYSWLGFDMFRPYSAYSIGDFVTYEGGFFVFTSNHPAGQWDEDDVADASLVDYIDDLFNGKADKVSGATAGDFAGLDSNGNLTDSGSKASDFATAAQGTKADTAYQKPASGIPASDLESAVQTSLGKADTALQSFTETDPVFSASPAAGITSGDISNWDGKQDPIPVVDASTVPASMDADKVYQYGTLSGDTTFPALATPSDLTVAHVYCWTFATPSTAPTITWPVAITAWAGGSAPTINASKSYEVSVMDGFATIIEA